MDDLQIPRNLRISLIVARANNDVIGNGDKLAWRIPEELQHFKTATMGHTLVMGRKTWQSIGRPLPGRRTIVVSANATLVTPGCELVSSLAAAFKLAGTATSEHPAPGAEVFIAGGAQIYRQTVAFATRVLLTQVDLEPPGDALFRWSPPESWLCTARVPAVSTTGIGFEIQDWRCPPST